MTGTVENPLRCDNIMYKKKVFVILSETFERIKLLTRFPLRSKSQSTASIFSGGKIPLGTLLEGLQAPVKKNSDAQRRRNFIEYYKGKDL
mgnify:CR=1 FL=1